MEINMKEKKKNIVKDENNEEVKTENVVLLEIAGTLTRLAEICERIEQRIDNVNKKIKTGGY